MDTLTEKHFQQPSAQAPLSTIVKFTNFSDEDFTHTWNNIPYTFKAGTVKFMESGLANHFAKHFINRELLKRGRENDTSPKPNTDGKIENPFFMELYHRCIEPVSMEEGPTDQTKLEADALDMDMKAKIGEDMHSNLEAPAKEKNKGKDKNKAETKKPKEEKEFEEVEVPASDDDPA